MKDHNQKSIEQDANTYAETVDSMGRLFAREGYIAGRSKTDEEKDKRIGELEEALREVCEDLDRICDGYTGFKADSFESHEKAQQLLNK